MRGFALLAALLATALAVPAAATDYSPSGADYLVRRENIRATGDRCFVGRSDRADPTEVFIIDNDKMLMAWRSPPGSLDPGACDVLFDGRPVTGIATRTEATCKIIRLKDGRSQTSVEYRPRVRSLVQYDTFGEVVRGWASTKQVTLRDAVGNARQVQLSGNWQAMQDARACWQARYRDGGGADAVSRWSGEMCGDRHHPSTPEFIQCSADAKRESDALAAELKRRLGSPEFARRLAEIRENDLSPEEKLARYRLWLGMDD